jgi:hypothetical protein
VPLVVLLTEILPTSGVVEIEYLKESPSGSEILTERVLVLTGTEVEPSTGFM